MSSSEPILPVVTLHDGDRVLVLESPEPSAVGKTGTVVIRAGWPFVDLGDGSDFYPLVRSAALIDAGKS